MYCVTVKLRYTSSHHWVMCCSLGGWHSYETVCLAFCFLLIFCVVLISVDLDFYWSLPQHSRFFGWDCLYIVTVLWWYLICYSPSSSKKSLVSVFSAIEIEELKRKTKQKSLTCWMSEDITCLNITFPLCCSLLTPSQHMCMNTDIYTEVHTCLCTCKHAYLPTHIHAHIFCRRRWTFCCSL